MSAESRPSRRSWPQRVYHTSGGRPGRLFPFQNPTELESRRRHSPEDTSAARWLWRALFVPQRPSAAPRWRQIYRLGACCDGLPTRGSRPDGVAIGTKGRPAAAPSVEKKWVSHDCWLAGCLPAGLGCLIASLAAVWTAVRPPGYRLPCRLAHRPQATEPASDSAAQFRPSSGRDFLPGAQ